MQNKELHFVLQVIEDYTYKKPYGYIPIWKDLEKYPCGLKKKNFHKAKQEAEAKLEEYRKNDFKKSYRIIKRYIPIKNDLQIKLF